MQNTILDNGSNECTGCSACAAICPTSAIYMGYDENGFYVPFLEENKCIECGLCKEVCYKYLEDSHITPRDDYKSKPVLAVTNNYVEQMHLVSTSGVATQLAKHYFKKGYKVCGAAFNDDFTGCEHIVARDVYDIIKFKGSKYLQSACSRAFSQLIKTSKKSIIFGTPCQIYGIRKLIKLKKIEDSFILVDLFCVGVPSLNLWVQYKDFISRNYNLENLKQVNFRDKTQGWHKYSIKVINASGLEYRENIFNDMFFSFYLKKVCLNKPCYDCKLRHNAVYSDIRLGDFWGDKYSSYDDGVSIMVLLTKRGEKAWDSIKTSFRFEECKTEDIFISQKYNKIEIPEPYNEVIKALQNKEKLEKINAKFGIHKLGYK